MASKKILAQVLLFAILAKCFTGYAQESSSPGDDAKNIMTSVEPTTTTTLAPVPTTTTTTTLPPKPKTLGQNSEKPEEPVPEYVEFTYPEFLENEKKIDKFEVQEQGYFGRKSEGEKTEDKYIYYTKRVYRKLNFWGAYGLGLPVQKFKLFSKHYIFGADYRLSERLWVGFFFKNISATTVQSIHFDDTGYDEERTYLVTAILLGPHFTFHLDGKYYLVGNVGFSLADSALQSVSTNAPLSSTLEVGKKKTAPLGIGYNLGLRYEFKMKTNYAWGIEGGYGDSNASNAEASIKEIYSGLYFKYYGLAHSQQNKAAKSSAGNE